MPARKRRQKLRLCACCAFLAASSSATQPEVTPLQAAVHVVDPKNEWWAPSWEPIVVRYALHVPDTQDSTIQKCFQVDEGGKACSPLAENSSVVLGGLHPGGWHELIATVEIADTGDLLNRETTRFFTAFSQQDPWGHSLLNMRGATAHAGEAGACVAGRSCPEASALRADLFDSVYEHGSWSRLALPGSPLSGEGSAPAAARGAKRAIEEAIARDGVASMLDAPCGDMTWMQHVDLGGAAYLGVDVSSVVIEQNLRSFPPGASNFSFQKVDLVSDPWPQGYDLILVRDLMYHQTPAANLAVLEKLQQSGARLALISTHLLADENSSDYLLVQGHKVNLLRRPYCLRAPDRMYLDGLPDRYIGVWELDDGRGSARPLRDESGPFCAV